MPKLQCDICGGSIVMQPGGLLAVCDSCGMQYSTGRIREKVQEIRGVVSVEGTVQTQDADFIIRGGVLTRYNGNEIHVTIPDTVVEIGQQAFENCAGIQSVKMSQSVTCIGDHAFSGCRSLTSVKIPQTVTCIGAYAFSGCRSLTDVELSKYLTEIGNYAFFECAALKKILLPDTLVTVGSCAFSRCISLESINIPDSLQGFLGGTFENCPALKEVRISDQQVKSLFGREIYGKFRIYEEIFETREYDDTYIDENCGPWYLNFKHIVEVENENIRARMDHWMKRRLCRYCGGKFTGGIFSKAVCRNCGKEKDYIS